MVNEVNAFQQEVKVDQGASYKDSHRSVFFLGEEAILDSAEDDEGEAFSGRQDSPGEALFP